MARNKPGAYIAHKSECRHNQDLSIAGKSNNSGVKMSELYYKPKITDGYLVKKTNRINWDTLD